MLDKLGYDTLLDIGKCLDYDSRVNYNQVVPFEARYVKNLESDSHNLYVKTGLIKSKLDRIQLTEYHETRVIKFTRLFNYMAKTRDTILFVNTSESFRATLIRKLDESIDPRVYAHYSSSKKKKFLSNMKNLRNQILVKLDILQFETSIQSKCVQIL